MNSDLAFGTIVTAYIAAAFVWPTVRVWRRHGVWPIVFKREAAPAQRLLGALSGALLVVVVGLAGVRVWAGSEHLMVVEVPVLVHVAGWLAMLLGLALTVAAQRQMGASWRVGIDDRRTELVIEGLFRLVRNPIFAGLLLFLAGFVLLLPAWWSAGLWIATFAAIRMQVILEEKHLIELHGPAYVDYASRVGRFWPWLGRLPPS